MSIKKGIEIIKLEFESKDYTLLTKDYVNLSKTRFEYICNKHKSIGVQNVSYTSFKNNRCNCKQCSKEIKISNWHSTHPKKDNNDKLIAKTKLYKDKVYQCAGDEYTLSSIFIKNNHTYLELIHNSCGHRYDVEQYNFIMNNHRCPNCRGKRISETKTKTLEQFKKEVYDLVGKEYIVIGDYNSTHANTTFRHIKCGRNFEKHPNNFFKGQRCPYCIKPSKGEQRIMDILDKVMPNQYIFQMSYDNLLGVNDRKLSYDFYLPSKNLLIEYQGQFHDGSVEIQTVEKFEYQKEHDRRKKEYAQDNNIKLLEIWYWDFENIEEILKKELSIS